MTEASEFGVCSILVRNAVDFFVIGTPLRLYVVTLARTGNKVERQATILCRLEE